MAVDLTARALITLEEGRRYCWRKDGADSRDDILADAINDVSDSIVDYCRREFTATTGRTTLNGGINGAVTSLVVAAFAAFPAANGFKVKIDDEILLVTAGAGTSTWTVTRAQNDTTPAVHADDAIVDGLEERVFDYQGAGTLDLDPYDLRAFGAVTLYTDRDEALQATLTSAQYRLEPRGATPADTYLALTLPYPAVQEPDYGYGWQTTVLGAWGMVEVPGSVKLACKQWVDNIVQNPGSYASQTMGGYTVTPEIDDLARAAGMPAAVRHRLERWRRHRNQGMSVVRFARTGLAAPGIPHQLPTI